MLRLSFLSGFDAVASQIASKVHPWKSTWKFREHPNVIAQPMRQTERAKFTMVRDALTPKKHQTFITNFHEIWGGIFINRDSNPIKVH